VYSNLVYKQKEGSFFNAALVLICVRKTELVNKAVEILFAEDGHISLLMEMTKLRVSQKPYP